MPPDLRSTVLLRSEDSGGHLSVVENVVPARSAGPPLHSHGFDETFYVLEGELVVRVGDALLARTAGQLPFAPRGVAHALANRRDAPVRYLLVCTPAGFERHFARTAAAWLKPRLRRRTGWSRRRGRCSRFRRWCRSARPSRRRSSTPWSDVPGHDPTAPGGSRTPACLAAEG